MKFFYTIALTACLLVACTQYKQNAMLWYQQGQSAYKQQDYHTAYLNLVRAAQAGNLDAQYAVGYMLYNGIGTPRDQTRAFAWLQQAAQQGQPRAIQALQKLNATANQQAFSSNPP